MASHISAEEMEGYKHTARARLQAEKRQREERRERAWGLARRAADLLKRDFAVSRVAVFGSLVHQSRFHLFSDIDLAAWGLTSENWLRAISAVHALSDEIELNLLDITICSSELLAVIEKEGMAL